MVAKPTGELFLVNTTKDGLTCSRSERLPLTEKALDEDWLQNLIDKCPDLLPVEDIDERVETPLVSIGREVETDAGIIDNLLVSTNGQLVVVETKLWRNPEARRSVVAQILDYAKHVRRWAYDKLCKIAGGDLHERVKPDEEARDWVDRLNANQRRGRMTLLVVGDGIHTEAEGLVQIIGNHPDFAFRLALVELRIYPQGDGRWLIVNSVLARTAEIERAIVTIENKTESTVVVTTPVASPGRPSRSTLSEEAFRESLRKLPSGDELAKGADKMLRAVEHRDDGALAVEWRSASFVVRAPDPGGSGKMLSLCVVTNKGQVYAFLAWLTSQLAGAYSNAAIKRIGELRIALWTKFGGVLTKAQDEISVSLLDLAGKEEAFIAAMATLVHEIGKESAQD